jgi:Icc-related predicted phosphoesterase
MKICCLSDLHGHLPNIPECDLLLLAGDYPKGWCGEDHWWYRDNFQPWLEYTSQKCKIIGVAGNHDRVFQKNFDSLPKMEWTYLQDSGTEWNGLKIWGSPWQPRFYDWAFNADEAELKQKWDLIPENTDVLVLHGPPHGYGDRAPRVNEKGYENTGSPSLLERIKSLKLKLVVAGHIHSGYGRYQIGETIFVNAAFVNEQYIPSHEPIVVEL